MIAAELLHLARPSPDIIVPSNFGPVPPTPGVSFTVALITPLLTEILGFSAHFAIHQAVVELALVHQKRNVSRSYLLP